VLIELTPTGQLTVTMIRRATTDLEHRALGNLPATH